MVTIRDGQAGVRDGQKTTQGGGGSEADVTVTPVRSFVEFEQSTTDDNVYTISTGAPRAGRIQHISVLTQGTISPTVTSPNITWTLKRELVFGPGGDQRNLSVWVGEPDYTASDSDLDGETVTFTYASSVGAVCIHWNEFHHTAKGDPVVAIDEDSVSDGSDLEIGFGVLQDEDNLVVVSCAVENQTDVSPPAGYTAAGWTQNSQAGRLEVWYASGVPSVSVPQPETHAALIAVEIKGL